MRAIPTLVLVVSSLALVACGGDDGDGTTPPIDAPAANCTVSSTSFAGGTLAGNSTFRAGQTAGIGDITAVMPLEAAPPTDVLIVEFYTGFAPFGTPQAPTAIVAGTYQLSGSQLQYADCGVCVRVGTNAMETGAYDDDYMATGGTVTVTQAGTAVGGQLAFSLSNITFEHVTINEETFQSTPVGDGCNTALPSGNHSSTLAAPQAKPGMTQIAFPLNKRLGAF